MWVSTPKLMRRINATSFRYNTSAIALTYCITKCCSRNPNRHLSRTDQPRLIVGHEGIGSSDELLPWLKRIVISLNNCATFTTQGVVVVKYKDDLHHEAKIGVCYTIGEAQTTENCADVFCTVDVDIASEGTIFWYSD